MRAERIKDKGEVKEERGRRRGETRGGGTKQERGKRREERGRKEYER